MRWYNQGMSSSDLFAAVGRGNAPRVISPEELFASALVVAMFIYLIAWRIWRIWRRNRFAKIPDNSVKSPPE